MIEDFGPFLAKIRRKHAMCNVSEFADKIGRDRTYVSSLEHNLHNHTPSIETLKRISGVTLVPLEVLRVKALFINPYSPACQKLYNESERKYMEEVLELIRKYQLNPKKLYLTLMRGLEVADDY